MRHAADDSAMPTSGKSEWGTHWGTSIFSKVLQRLASVAKLPMLGRSARQAKCLPVNWSPIPETPAA